MALKLRETMWATMRPDCYGGKSCDKIRPQWSTYGDGDKQGEEGERTLQLAARSFPPGTKITIAEPQCPKCGEVRDPIFPAPKRGPLFAAKCGCGFDWNEWTLEQFS